MDDADFTSHYGRPIIKAPVWKSRFAVFDAGMASARDPRYTVIPQRARMAARENGHARTVTGGGRRLAGRG